MKAVIYARYSSYNQQEQSIEGQIRAIRQYAKAKNIEIIDEYIDRAKSGTNSNRPAFQKLLKDSFDHEFQYVLIYQFDRFARNRLEHITNETLLMNNGVKLISVTENINDEDSTSVIIKGFFESIAEYYSVDLSKKVKRGLKESVIARKSLGGIRWLGYKTDDNHKIYVDKEEANVVRRIFEMRLCGVSVERIAKILNEEGIMNKNAPFNRCSVRKILDNRKYLGEYQNPYDETEIIFDMYPRIIDEHIFNAVQGSFEPMKIRSSKKDEDGNSFYLTGKLFSAVDGTPFSGTTGTSKTGRKYHYYKAKINGELVTYRQDIIEERIIDNIKAIVSTDIFSEYVAEKLVAAAKQKMSSKRLNELNEEKRQIKIKLENSMSAYETADKEIRHLFAERIQARERELSAINKKIAIEESRIKPLDKEFARQYLLNFLNRDLSDPVNREKFFYLILNSAFIKDKHIDIYINFDVPELVSFDKYKTDLSAMDKSVRLNAHLAEDIIIDANFRIIENSVLLSFSI